MSEGVGEAIRPDFLFHESSGMNDHRQRESTEREPSEGHSSNHPLARRMLWLLHEAKVNTWPRPYGTSDRKALLKLAEQIELAQGLFLRDVLYCDARAWREGWMESGFHKYQKHGLKPQVWWLCEIDHASQKEGFVRLAGATQTTRIDGKLAVYGGDGAAVRYPMLMCALVGKLTDGSVKILQAYAHPIQALDWWLPVDSNLERDAVDDLLGVPPRQNSCRLDRTMNPGAAMKDDSGSIRTSIQRQSGGQVAATGERAGGGGLARSWCGSGNAGALA